MKMKVEKKLVIQSYKNVGEESTRKVQADARLA